MKILVTGAAGFIGFHLTKQLALNGHQVVGIDNINDYYDPNLKFARLKENGIAIDSVQSRELISIQSKFYINYQFQKLDLINQVGISALFAQENFEVVVNLAAQAGVRYSLKNPHSYIESNIVGFLNILESCRAHQIKHLVYASSSSIYGLNKKMPLSPEDNVDHPISLYAATKKSNELMAHTYSHLYNLPTTGLRFFTVYGPWGRPDMAYYLFTEAIQQQRPIKVYNHGQMLRDFTYIDDVITGILKVIHHPPKGNQQWSATTPNPASSSAPYKLYNIGNSSPVKLMDFIETLEKEIGISAIKTFLPMQPGDVVATYADITALKEDLGYQPITRLKEGIEQFIDWYQTYTSITKLDKVSCE